MRISLQHHVMDADRTRRYHRDPNGSLTIRPVLVPIPNRSELFGGGFGLALFVATGIESLPTMFVMIGVGGLGSVAVLLLRWYNNPAITFDTDRRYLVIKDRLIPFGDVGEVHVFSSVGEDDQRKIRFTVPRFETYIRLGEERLVLGKFEEREPAEELAEEVRTLLAGKRWTGRV